MRNKIIACDLGTGGNKASLYNAEGENLASAFVPYETFYPGSGMHEQRPDDWWEAVTESIRSLREETGFTSGEIAAISLSGHSLGCVPLDGDGNVLRELTPIWSDTRSSKQTASFFKKIDPSEWYMKTGNGFPPECYTIFKIMWYRDNEPEMFSRIKTIIGTKDYINYLLTGTIKTDYSYASGSGVFNLRKGDYGRDLLEASGIARELLPEIVPSTEVIGCLTEQAASALGFGEDGIEEWRGIDVVCGGVDNSCMALGAGNTDGGKVYTSLGSSSWIAVSSDVPVLDEKTRPFVFAHVLPGLYTSAVSIFAAGSSFAWLRDVMCKDLAEMAEIEGTDVYNLMVQEAEASPVGAKGLLFNPSLAGGSSQEASPHIRGAFGGIDLQHTRGDVIRSVMEGIALNLGCVFEELKKKTSLYDEILFVGGGSKSPFWLQMFSNIFEMTVKKSKIDQDAGSLGAAALAAVGSGLWEDFSLIDKLHREGTYYRPDGNNVKKYKDIRKVFELQREQSAELGQYKMEVLNE